MKDKILNVLLLLTVAAALILTLAQGDSGEGPPGLAIQSVPTLAPAPTAHPIDAYRARRAETRAQEQGLLRALVQSQETAPETRALAEKQLLEITENLETELAVEAALAAQGYGQALCVARAGGLTICLAQELTERQAALIVDLARAASGVAKENIRIAAC